MRQSEVRAGAARHGFTLIELLVAIGIIIVLASLALLITPRFAEDQKTARGADLLQGWLLIAKQRAIRDQVPRGVRLVPDASNVVRELLYIERPEDLRFDSFNQIQVPAITAPTPLYHTVFIANMDLTAGDAVLRGDFLQTNALGSETQPYNLHTIDSVTYPYTVNGVQGTLLMLAAKDGTPSPIGGFGPMGQQGISLGATTSFQFVRQPRPMIGEPVLHLPKDIAIDLDPNTVGTSVLPGVGNPDFLDIMFSARGQVTGSNGTGGKIILRVRNVDKPFNPALSIPPNQLIHDHGEQILIVLYTRTGLISAFPVNNDPATMFLNPYLYTRDDKKSGM